MFSHPATTFVCRHCGQSGMFDYEWCLSCGPICGYCLNKKCPKEENESQNTQHQPTEKNNSDGLPLGGPSVGLSNTV
jgi:hypothetical protein